VKCKVPSMFVIYEYLLKVLAHLNNTTPRFSFTLFRSLILEYEFNTWTILKFKFTHLIGHFRLHNDNKESGTMSEGTVKN